MKKLVLNREYLTRHVFGAVVFLAMGAWFGYDGFVRYPAADAAALYETIEGAKPPAGADLGKFKRQKCASQRIFSAVLLVVGVVIALRLAQSARFRFSWGDDGFSAGSREYSYDDIVSVDSSRWEKNSVFSVCVPSYRIVLDGWHHNGVSEFREFLLGRMKESS